MSVRLPIFPVVSFFANVEEFFFVFRSYGDMTPTSVIGRLTGVICSLSGIMVVALPAPVLEKNFSRKSEEGRPHPAEKKKHAANSSKLTNPSTTVTNN